MKQHVGAERAFTAQGVYLQATLSESLKHVDALHTRVDFKKENEELKLFMLGDVKRDVTNRSSTVCFFLDAEVSSQ